MSTRPQACESQKDNLLAALERGVPLPVELHAHALSCAGCRAALARWSAQARVLRAMPRAQVPAELDGRVVAAFHHISAVLLLGGEVRSLFDRGASCTSAPSATC